MLYKEISNNAAVNVLKNKMLAAADAIQVLVSEGYIPNKNKYTILGWSNLLIAGYKVSQVLSVEQRIKLDNLYNRLIIL